MIHGTVTEDGTPMISIPLAGETWQAVVDSGFNGDLELPERLKPAVNAQYLYRIPCALAGGREVEEDLYAVDFEFDGQKMLALASFAPGDQLLIGTHLLRRHHLAIDFPAQTVLIEQRI